MSGGNGDDTYVFGLGYGHDTIYDGESNILSGTDDTVLFKDSVTLEQRLILQGGDVDFVMLPDAPHGWDTRGLAQTRYAFHKLYDYFERYMPSASP